MKISHEKPKNWEKLVELFGANWGSTVVTYGETVHCSRPLTLDLEAHEGVHVEQQTAYPGGPDAWWERYYSDLEFRLTQETEAYQVQYDYMRKHSSDRNLLFKLRDKLARDMSSKLYGNCISYEAAFCTISQKQKKQAVAA